VAEAAHVPSSPVALTIDKEGIGTLIRKEASATSRHTLEANRSDADLGDLDFYVLNLERRKTDKFKALQRVIENKAPWMMDRICRVSAPDAQAWDYPSPTEAIITNRAWEDICSYDNSLHGELIQEEARMTKGGVACTVGHGLMWEHIVRKGAPFAVVMEDDVIDIHPQAKDFLLRLLKDDKLQQGWDFLNLNPCKHEANHAPIRIKVGQHDYCTAMYVIKLEAARTLLQSTFPIGKDGAKAVQLDNQKGPLWGHLRGAITIPEVATAYHGITDIQVHLATRGITDMSQITIPDCAALKPGSMMMPELLNPTGI